MVDMQIRSRNRMPRIIKRSSVTFRTSWDRFNQCCTPPGPEPPNHPSKSQDLKSWCQQQDLADWMILNQCLIVRQQLIASCKTKVTKLTPRLQVWYFLDEWFGPVLTGLSWIGLRGFVMLKYTTELATMLCTAWTCASGTKFSTSTASIKQYQPVTKVLTDWKSICAKKDTHASTNPTMIRKAS